MLPDAVRDLTDPAYLILAPQTRPVLCGQRQMATSDLDVQTDIVRALKAFAQKPEQMANWNGFAIYCMKIAAAFLVEFEAEFGGSKKPAGLNPVILAQFNREQATLTMAEINDFVNGRKKPQDFNDFVNQLRGNPLKGENTKLQAIIDAKNKEITTLTEKMSMLEKTYAANVQGVKNQVTDLEKTIKELSSKLDENTTKSSEVTANFLTHITHEKTFFDSVHNLVTSKIDTFSPTDQTEIKALLTVISEKAKSNNDATISWYTSHNANLTKELEETRDTLAKTKNELAELRKSKTSISEKSREIFSSFNALLTAVETQKFDIMNTSIGALSDMSAIRNDLGDNLFVIFNDLKKNLINISLFMFFSLESTQKSFLVFYDKIADTFETQCTSQKLKRSFYLLLGFSNFPDFKKFYTDFNGTQLSCYKFPCITLEKNDDLSPKIELKKMEVEIEKNNKILSKLHLKQLESNFTILRLSLFLQHILNIIIFFSDDIQSIQRADGKSKYPGFLFHFQEILKYANDDLCKSDFVRAFNSEIDNSIKNALTVLFHYLNETDLHCWHAPLSLFHHGMYLNLQNANLYVPPVFYVNKTKRPEQTQTTTFAELNTKFHQFMESLSEIDPEKGIASELNQIPFDI